MIKLAVPRWAIANRVRAISGGLQRGCYNRSQSFMETACPPLHIDRETRNAFNELLLMEQLSALPVGSLLRVLQTIPSAVLAAAQEKAAKA